VGSKGRQNGSYFFCRNSSFEKRQKGEYVFPLVLKQKQRWTTPALFL
jgi:hypothetical protein